MKPSKNQGFTPKPWRVINPSHGNETEYKCVQIGSNEMYTTLEMLPADAKLIASAPLLYEACIELIASIDAAKAASPRQMIAIADAEKVLRKAGKRIPLREWLKGLKR